MKLAIFYHVNPLCIKLSEAGCCTNLFSVQHQISEFVIFCLVAYTFPLNFGEVIAYIELKSLLNLLKVVRMS